ncbi:MAG: Holliday junction branch migration protein RuvA [candidate division KSB1 bacterium]|nr:Holliday junction branch migration protein RuvA [candidate division KSB1 bacterium]MDZ7340382.1 Holliday junction branch migration protein RuvA [candidate division KSB1 bacterium]
MISYLRGYIAEKQPTRLILDVNGVGYELNITVPFYEKVGAIGDQVMVLTYLHVREDILQLYGFQSAFERELFLQLLTIPGIGPRKAQIILSSVSAENLQRFILEEDLGALTAISGVGKKTGQRLIVDLKDKLKPVPLVSPSVPVSEMVPSTKVLIEEASKALVSLGFSKNNATVAIQRIIEQQGASITLEELIKQALRAL